MGESPARAVRPGRLPERHPPAPRARASAARAPAVPDDREAADRKPEPKQDGRPRVVLPRAGKGRVPRPGRARARGVRRLPAERPSRAARHHPAPRTRRRARRGRRDGASPSPRRGADDARDGRREAPRGRHALPRRRPGPREPRSTSRALPGGPGRGARENGRGVGASERPGAPALRGRGVGAAARRLGRDVARGAGRAGGFDLARRADVRRRALSNSPGRRPDRASRGREGRNQRRPPLRKGRASHVANPTGRGSNWGGS